jgi:hypothetical protein
MICAGHAAEGTEKMRNSYKILLRILEETLSLWSLGVNAGILLKIIKRNKA